MRNMLWRFTLVFGILIGLQAVLCAQKMNVDKISATVVQGEQWAQVFSSTEFLNIVYNESNGTIIAESGAGTDDIYFAKFTPNKEFLGVQNFAVEYVDYFGQKWYTEVEVKVVKSIIKASKDFIFIPNGDTNGSVDVLSNDVGSGQSLSIKEIGPVFNGRAEKQGSQGITFYPNVGFKGVTSFIYTVEDPEGTTAVGKVFVNVAGVKPGGGVTHLTVVNTATADLLLPGEAFFPSDEFILVHGSIKPSSTFSYEYAPQAFAEGVDVIKFVNKDGVEYVFEIEVINNQSEIDFVVDDKIYTTERQYVSFDARANDYSKKGVMVDFSPELIYGSGVFAYNPPAGFSGVKNFYYVVHDGFAAHKGNIQIFVGNYLPQKEHYEMSTKMNTPHVLEYQIPVKNFSFRIVQTPSNGNLAVNNSVYSDVGDCGTVTGFEMIVYQPNKGFHGSDEFIIEYCTDRGACKEVSILMTVEESDGKCDCIGPDCIWSGDTNNDGKVSVLDLLPIGYHYGESGPERTEGASKWSAQEGEDWLFNQKEALVNTKFADSDGNGIINQDDVQALYQHYESYHNIVPQEVLVIKDFPILFDFSQNDETIKPGDFLGFDVVLGTADYPVLDIQGLAFSIQVPPNIVKEGSMAFNFVDRSWFTYNAPALSMIQQTNNQGRLDVAIVRVDASAISGKGKIGSAGLIAVEELDGFRPEGDIIPVQLKIEESIVSDGNGNYYRIQGQDVTFNIDISGKDKESALAKAEVVMYPNPSKGSVTFHANNYDELVSIDIYSILGERVFSQKSVNSKSKTLNLDIGQGMYVAHIVTRKGKTVQKFQVIKE